MAKSSQQHHFISWCWKICLSVFLDLYRFNDCNWLHSIIELLCKLSTSHIDVGWTLTQPKLSVWCPMWPTRRSWHLLTTASVYEHNNILKIKHSEPYRVQMVWQLSLLQSLATRHLPQKHKYMNFWPNSAHNLTAWSQHCWKFFDSCNCYQK